MSLRSSSPLAGFTSSVLQLSLLLLMMIFLVPLVYADEPSAVVSSTSRPSATENISNTKATNRTTKMSLPINDATESASHTPLIVAIILFLVIGVLIAGIIFIVCHDQKLRDDKTHGPDDKTTSTKKGMAKSDKKKPTNAAPTCNFVNGGSNGKSSNAASSISADFCSKTGPKIAAVKDKSSAAGESSTGSKSGKAANFTDHKSNVSSKSLSDKMTNSKCAKSNGLMGIV